MSDPASDPPPNREIRQQADHSQNVIQIGHAGSVNINHGAQASSPPGPPAPSREGSNVNRIAIVVAVIGLIGTLLAALIGILPDLLAAAPTATPTLTATLPATDSPTLVPTLVASESPVPASPSPPPLPPTSAGPDDSALPVTIPATSGVDLVLYRDASSLTLYLPNQGTVSLEDLSFRVVKIEGPLDYPLQGFEFGLSLDALPTPLCLRLERNRSSDPLPIACTVLTPQGRVISRALVDADVFWHNGRVAFPVLIYAGDVQLGIFGTDSAELHLSYPR